MSSKELIDIVTPDGRILVKEIEQENKTAGGIILSQTADTENLCRLGKIIYNGITVDGHVNTAYQEGNKVYFGKFAGATINHNGQKYVSLVESEVSAITI